MARTIRKKDVSLPSSEESEMTTSVEKSKVEIINQNDRSEKVGPCKRIGAALFYAASSFFIVMFNKSLLTSYR